MDLREDNRIWPPFEAFYIESLLFCCNSAIRSIDFVADTFDAFPDEMTDADIDSLPMHELLDAMQNIVQQGAAISRYFWPVRNKGPYERRATHLRGSLRILDDNPLRKRDLRNSLEHFDERLDDYLEIDRFGTFLPAYIGPEVPRVAPLHHFFRAYYLDSQKFVILDQEFDLEPIVNEIFRLQVLLEECVRRGSRLPL